MACLPIAPPQQSAAFTQQCRHFRTESRRVLKVAFFLWSLILMAVPLGSEQSRGGSVKSVVTQVRLGDKVAPQVIASADPPCGSFDPCHVFQVSVDKPG